MSDRQDQKNELKFLSRVDNLRNNGYNLDQSTLERLANNMPASWSNMDRVAPGTALSQQQLNEFWAAFKQGKFVDGAENLSFEQYLNDPRSPLKVENGQVVWRPEKMQGDFQGKDLESFMDVISPIMSVALPALGGATLSYLGGMGSAAGASSGFLGDAASTGAGGLGEFSGSMAWDAPGLQGGTYALKDLATDTLGDFSLAGQGTGYGGVGTAGQGLSLGAGSTGGAIGDMAASLASQAGVDALAPISGIGAGTGAGLGLQAAGTGANIAGTGSWFDTLFDTIQTPGVQSLLKGGATLLEAIQQSGNADKLQAAIDAAANRGDPFGSQRGFYQNMLRDSYTDPNFWKNNAVFKGINDVAVNDASRAAAARGYNNSSNVLYDIADRIQKTGMNYATNFQGQLAQNAGAGIAPGTAASIAATGAQQVNQANQQSQGATGALIRDLPNIVQGIKGILP